MAQVNEEGTPVAAAPTAEDFDAAVALARRLEGENRALVNVLTVLVTREGGDVQIKQAELDALAHSFTMGQDPATKDVLLKAVRRDGAAIARRLTDEQVRQNALAAEVALPKAGAIIMPQASKIILP